MPPPAASLSAAPALPTRRAAVAALFLGAGGVAGCAAPLPPITWVRLPVDVNGRPPGSAGAAPTPGTPAAVWQLMSPVSLPGHLDRDALLLPQGSSGSLHAQAQLRWAEPLRDAVPRLLRLDLSQALGAPVWAAPLPPGLQPTRQLRVDLLALDVQPGGRRVLLLARYSLADAQGRSAPRAGEVRLVVDAPGAASDADALALAHRLAIARLAAQLVVQMRS